MPDPDARTKAADGSLLARLRRLSEELFASEERLAGVERMLVSTNDAGQDDEPASHTVDWLLSECEKASDRISKLASAISSLIGE